MLGIIPAAGRGTRLGMGCKPLVVYKGKHLIEYVFENMISMLVNEAIIIQRDNQISDRFGKIYKNDSGRTLRLLYLSQEEPKGIAHAISLAESFIDPDEKVCVILGDIIYQGVDLLQMRDLFQKMDYDCLVAMQKVEDKSLIKKSYGTYGDTKFIEKPKDEDLPMIENLLGLGIYMFSYKIFDAIKITEQSSLRNEIEITDALNNFKFRSWCTLDGLYKNINVPEDLQ